MTALSTMTTEEFDRRIDDGEDLEELFDMDHPIIEGPRRVNFTMPDWLIGVLDRQANRLGISRQALAIVWLADRAKQEGLVGNGYY